VSSSVNAISPPRALRQPTLRAPAGLRVRRAHVADHGHVAHARAARIDDCARAAGGSSSTTTIS
jgi:hypothetical protein